jgi:hypothetical protein
MARTGQSEKADAGCVGGRRRARRLSQFPPDVRDVAVNRVLAQDEALRDLGVVQAVRDEPEYLELASAQRPGGSLPHGEAAQRFTRGGLVTRFSRQSRELRARTGSLVRLAGGLEQVDRFLHSDRVAVDERLGEDRGCPERCRRHLPCEILQLGERDTRSVARGVDPHEQLETSRSVEPVVRRERAQVAARELGGGGSVAALE